MAPARKYHHRESKDIPVWRGCSTPRVEAVWRSLKRVSPLTLLMYDTCMESWTAAHFYWINDEMSGRRKMIYSISTVRGRKNYAAELSIKFEWFTSTCLVFFSLSTRNSLQASVCEIKSNIQQKICPRFCLQSLKKKNLLLSEYFAAIWCQTVGQMLPCYFFACLFWMNWSLSLEQPPNV